MHTQRRACDELKQSDASDGGPLPEVKPWPTGYIAPIFSRHIREEETDPAISTQALSTSMPANVSLSSTDLHAAVPTIPAHTGESSKMATPRRGKAGDGVESTPCKREVVVASECSWSPQESVLDVELTRIDSEISQLQVQSHLAVQKAGSPC